MLKKQRWEESEQRRAEERRSEKRKSQRQKMQAWKSFQWLAAPEGRKLGSLKRRCGAMWSDERWKIARRSGAKHMSKSKCTKHLSFGAPLEVAMSKNGTPLWREAHVEVKMYKTPQLRNSFRSCDVEKWHAVVVRSTFRSQNVQNTSASELL